MPQAMVVFREVGRHPVDNHADPRLVQQIDKVHEILRSAVAAGGSVIACGLVTPASREWMLADRQELDMREAHLAAIVGQLWSDLAITEPAIGIAWIPPPTAKVHFVNRHRRIECIVLRP